MPRAFVKVYVKSSAFSNFIRSTNFGVHALSQVKSLIEAYHPYPQQATSQWYFGVGENPKTGMTRYRLYASVDLWEGRFAVLDLEVVGTDLEMRDGLCVRHVQTTLSMSDFDEADHYLIERFEAAVEAARQKKMPGVAVVLPLEDTANEPDEMLIAATCFVDHYVSVGEQCK